MPEVIILSGKDLEELLTLEEVIELIKYGFVTYFNGGYKVFPVVRDMIDQYQGIFGIKSGYVTTEGLLGFKAGGYWKNNPKHNIPGYRSVVVLLDPRTGNPTTIMDGNIITTIRTSAVGALAAKYLARKDTAFAAIIGCGTQGRAQLQALKWALPIRSVKCNDVSKENAQRFAEEMSTDDCSVKWCPTVLEAVEGAEVEIGLRF